MPEERYLPCYGSLCLRPYLPGPPKPGPGTLTGDIRQHTVQSKVIGERTIMVYLPPGYSDKDPFDYPLALLQDGQNIFDVRTSVFGVEWGVDETAERLIVEQKIEPVILVAVYNSPRRVEEYTPFPDPEHGGGEAELYRAFLLQELLPFLESHYTLSRIPSQRAIIGSSLGGLLAMYMGWSSSDTFGLVGAMSPSLWWSRRAFITGMAGDPPPKVRPLIWLDAGTKETDSDINGNGVPDLIDDLRTMKAVLLYHGYQLDQDLHYYEIEGATHDENSWSQRVEDMLTTFFPRTDPRGTFR